MDPILKLADRCIPIKKWIRKTNRKRETDWAGKRVPTSCRTFKHMHRLVCVCAHTAQSIHLPPDCACVRMFWKLAAPLAYNNIVWISLSCSLFLCGEWVDWNCSTTNKTKTIMTTTAAVAAMATAVSMSVTATAKQTPRNERLSYTNTAHTENIRHSSEIGMKWSERVNETERVRKRVHRTETVAAKEKRLRKRENKSYLVGSVSVCL